MICSVADCGRDHHALGYCKMHYLRLKRHGNVDGKAAKEMRKCTVDECERKHYIGGLCGMHHAQMKRHGTIDAIMIEDLPGEKWADIEGRTGVMVSTLGRVKSVRKRHEKLLTPRLSTADGKAKGGTVVVSDATTGKDIQVAMEVLRAFVPNIHGDCKPHYKDGNRANCRCDNLAWYGYDLLIGKAIAAAEASSSKWADCFLKFWHGENSALDDFFTEMRTRLERWIPRRLDKLGVRWFRDVDEYVQNTLVSCFFAIKRGMVTNFDHITSWVFTIAENILNWWARYAIPLTEDTHTSAEGEEYSLFDMIGWCSPSAELEAEHRQAGRG